MLVADTKREAQAMAMLGWLVWVCWTLQVGDSPIVRHAPIYAGYWILALLFIPAVIMILRRANTAPIRSRSFSGQLSQSDEV
jgi:hypothetical protein